ncbi:uncharacterized protein LOC111806148 isoform X2 [Cucurbita pepo subsp. pepo]|uniref:uncharacterized protein LOC111806148 isoform X2 n=1 Tax=Cucurbita pepo subsp. pepo TaxID=3664 RepID=UPI000C9D6351|nr:uncharacterized protein LOC111806148 isoform X2 [Cucurbita pepo subsp. pepo]
MPGTIRVSVLEFIDLPELLSSPISIKVSMGKTHYETSDKGDFSFPLTTLRDDVILIIQDAGGNEISRAGVQVKSIVEKGYWDDLFPLEGGGRVHLQFQFALSEDDRSRIRMMRETALRRKHVERQDSNLKNSGSNLASSFNLNRELSDSQKCLLQIGDLSAKEAAHQSPSASNQNIPDEIPVTEKTNKIRLDRIQPLSVENDADRSKDNPSAIPLMQEVEVNKPKVNNTVLVDRMRMQSPHAIRPSPTSLEENLVHSRSSELSNSPSKGEGMTDVNEDKPSTTPLLQEVGVNEPKVNNIELVERKGTLPPCAVKPSPTIRSEENLVHSRSSELSNSPSKGEGMTDVNEDKPSTTPLLQEVGVNEPKVNNIELVERKGTLPPRAVKPSPTIRSEENLVHSRSSELSNSPSKGEERTDVNEDKPSTTPLLQEVGVNEPKVNNTELVERKGTQPPRAVKPSPTIRLEENLVHSRSSELSNSPSKGEEKTDASEAAPSRRRTPGNVKKVISAFESSLTQDTKPRIKPTRNTQPNVVEKQPSSEVNQSKDNSKPTRSQTTIGPPLAGELTHDLANTRQKEQKRKFFEASDGTKSLKLKGKKNQVGEENLSEKEFDDIDAKNDESYQKSVPEKPDYDRNSVTGESVSRVEDEQIPSKRSGGWIFTDERRRLCVTTGGDHMLDLVGGGRTSYTFIRKGEMKISTEENRGTSEPKANGGNHEHQKMIKPENSDDVKPSEGPLANALKVAVMLGLGTLVLLTRQRKKKK